MIAAIVVAAGSGSRLGGELPKQFQDLGGVPLVARAVWAMEKAEEIEKILVAVPPGQLEFAWRHVFGTLDWRVKPELVEGGDERWHSVERCLKRLSDPVTHVLVHDGARPLLSAELVRRVCDQVRKYGAVVTALREKNTLKRVSAAGWVDATVDRQEIWEAQTPQAFRLDVLKRAYERARELGAAPTDDCFLVERIGCPVRVVEGEEINFKVTTPFDMELARLLVGLAERTTP